MAIKFDQLLEALDPSLDEYLDESLNEDFSEDNIDYIGERLSRHIRRNGWDSFFDYPALAVRDNSENNRHFVVKSNKNSIIITDEDNKPIYSHELNSNNDLKTIVNEAAKEIIKNVKRFKIVHVNESLNETKLNEAFNINDSFKFDSDRDTVNFIDKLENYFTKKGINTYSSYDMASNLWKINIDKKEFVLTISDPVFHLYAINNNRSLHDWRNMDYDDLLEDCVYAIESNL